LRESVEQKRALAIYSEPTGKPQVLHRRSGSIDGPGVCVFRCVAAGHLGPILPISITSYAILPTTPPSRSGTVTGREKETQTLSAIAKEWGLFFIFRSDCPYCHRLRTDIKSCRNSLA